MSINNLMNAPNHGDHLSDSDDVDIRVKTPNAAHDEDGEVGAVIPAIRSAGGYDSPQQHHIPSPPSQPLLGNTTATIVKDDGADCNTEARGLQPSDSVASLLHSPTSGALSHHDRSKNATMSTTNGSGNNARKKQRKKPAASRRKTAEELAEERRKIDAAMEMLDEAKKKARAQRQDYGNYLSWKVTMQRQEHKQRELEEEKLRERVDQKLQQVLSEHRDLRRKELTAYRHFAHETPTTLLQTLGGNNTNNTTADLSTSRITNGEGPERIRVPRKRLHIADSFAEEDAHFQSYMVEQERKREEWARTKSLLHSNAMKAATVAKVNASQHPTDDTANTKQQGGNTTVGSGGNTTTNYAEVFTKESSSQKRPNDGYVHVKEPTGANARSAASQVATNLQRLARSYDMQPAPTRAAIQKRSQHLQTSTDGDGGVVEDESALVSQYKTLIAQTGGGGTGAAPICTMGPGGAASVIDPTTGLTLEYVIDDGASSGPLQPTSVDDALTIVKKNKLTQAEHDLLVKTSYLRQKDGQRRVLLDDMMAKARMRKEGATELLTLDPPADYIIANGLDRLLPTDLLQLAHNDQRSTDGLAHGKLKKPAETYYLLNHEENELNLASKKKLRGVLAQRRAKDDEGFFMTEVTGDADPENMVSPTRKPQSAPVGGPSPPAHRKPSSTSISQVHRLPRSTKSSWYPKFSPNPYLVTPVATKKELDALVRQQQPVPQETLSGDNNQNPPAIDFKSFGNASSNYGSSSPSKGRKIVLDTLAALQGDDYVPYNDSKASLSSSSAHHRPSQDPSAPKVVAVRFPPRNHQEEKAIYDWHTKQESVTVHSKIRTTRQQSIGAASGTSGTGAGGGGGWHHKSKPFLPPLKSMFVDPDLDTAKKFLHTKRTV